MYFKLIQMDSEYYNNARRWFNTIYVFPCSDRLPYFVVFAICLINIYISISLFNYMSEHRSIRYDAIIKVEKRIENQYATITHLDKYRNNNLDILNLLISKYVTNRENLIYKSSNGMNVLNNKKIKVKNISSSYVYDTFVSKLLSQDDDSDLSYVIRGKQKYVEIEDLNFIYSKENFIKNLYQKLTLDIVPSRAKVVFSMKNNNREDDDELYEADISYTYFISNDKNKKSFINFTVNSYEVKKIEDE